MSQNAMLRALADESSDILLGHGRFVAGPKPQQTQTSLGQQAENPDHRAAGQHHRSHDRGCGHSQSFGPGHAQPFGDEFPENERQDGERDDHGAKREGMGIGGEGRHPAKNFGQFGGQGCSAVGAGQNAGQGNANLDGGEKSLGTIQQAQTEFGPTAAGGGQGCESGFARGDEGHFGHGKKTVNADKCNDGS